MGNLRFERREDLISLARYGKITPKQAEAEAAAHGWEAFAREPDLPDFDPMMECRWSIVMTIAWIASRDLQVVRQNCSGYRSQSIQWVFRHWNELEANGADFTQHSGWFLESWHEATTVGLTMREKHLKRGNQATSWQMSVPEAERALWRALADGLIVSEALDENARPTEIPQYVWSYLELFEEGKRDILKYDALDRVPAFTEAKLKPGDVFKVWPAAKDEPVIADLACSSGPNIASSTTTMDRPDTSGGVAAEQLRTDSPAPLKASCRIFKKSSEETFKEWRALMRKSKHRLPTYDEDVAHMKQHGFGRERVRELRKEFPSRLRGSRLSVPKSGRA